MHRFGEARHTLNRCRAGADDADPFVGQSGQAGAGVAVVPAAGVECMTAELGNACNSRKFRLLQIAIRHGHKPGADLVAAVGGDHPSGSAAPPRGFREPRSADMRHGTSRSARRCVGSARRSRPPWRTSRSGRSRALRATACRRRTRRRRRFRGNDSNTRFRRRRQPCRSTGRPRRRVACTAPRSVRPPKPAPTIATSTSSVIGSRAKSGSAHGSSAKLTECAGDLARTGRSRRRAAAVGVPARIWRAARRGQTSRRRPQPRSQSLPSSACAVARRPPRTGPALLLTATAEYWPNLCKPGKHLCSSTRVMLRSSLQHRHLPCMDTSRRRCQLADQRD